MACLKYGQGYPRAHSHVLRPVGTIYIFKFFFSIIESAKLKNILGILAKKHPTRKFMQI
jgi:hypothetical protein